MSKTDKATEASKVELTDEALDGAQGGAGYLKLGDIEGEVQSGDRITETFSLNFSKVEFEYVKQTKAEITETATTRLKL